DVEVAGAQVVEQTSRAHLFSVTEVAWRVMVAKTQAGEVKQWLDETRLLIRAAELLVEWFSEEGSEIDEYAAFKESLDLPHKNLGLIDEWLRVGDTAPDRVNKWTARQFCAGEEVAR